MEERPVSAQYEPPGGLTPAEAGTLLDETVDMRDITATVVDLAVAGHLKIEEREEKHLFGLISNTDYVFYRLEPKAGARPLEPHEQAVLDGLFEGAARSVALSDLDQEFYTHLPRHPRGRLRPAGGSRPLSLPARLREGALGGRRRGDRCGAHDGRRRARDAAQHDAAAVRRRRLS